MDTLRRIRTLPDNMRELALLIVEPAENRTTLPSGSIVITGIAPFPAAQGPDDNRAPLDRVREYARRWYEWAWGDWQAAAAFRATIDLDVAKLRKDGRHDLYSRAVNALDWLTAEIRKLAAADKRQATRECSITLALSACAGEPGSGPQRHRRADGDRQPHQGGNGVPRNTGSGKRDAKRGAQVGPRVRRANPVQEAAAGIELAARRAADYLRTRQQ